MDQDFLRERSALPLGVQDEKIRQEMLDKISEVAANGDSIGAILECGISGFPAGLGSPMFDGLENRISSAIFAIPAVKGIEFGLGFDFCKMTGSEANDEMYYDENGVVKTYTNHNGGILGGISNGMPIIFTTIIKPTPSIAKPQRTVNLKKEKDDILEIKGRHDSCIAVRALPVVENMTAIALVDSLYE
ncbi:Chorismate synthase [bioreactor metagenome]|uniref:chorismate synthase n=1 Tax=bioreactor metagenome TaxID=1076179 RepID=A0A645DCF3_9ZZZZ